MRLHLLALALVLAIAGPLALAKEGGFRRGYSTGTHGKVATGVPRDAHGPIKRSQEAIGQLKKVQPCPSTGKPFGACPGYVIDHVVPLMRAGDDSPSNIQFAAKAKNKWE